jgi:acyl dehydratase
MVQTSDLEYDRSVIGVEVVGEPQPITKELILTFCAAIGETNPLFTDEDAAKAGPYGGLVAPPSFWAALEAPDPPDPQVTFGNSSIGGGRHCTFVDVIRPGDTITPSIAIAEVYEKTGRSGRMVFVVRRTTFNNQHGNAVAIADQITIKRNVEGAEGAEQA